MTGFAMVFWVIWRVLTGSWSLEKLTENMKKQPTQLNEEISKNFSEIVSRYALYALLSFISFIFITALVLYFLIQYGVIKVS